MDRSSGAGPQRSVVLFTPGFPANERETHCLAPVQNLVRVLARRNPAVAFHVIAFQYPFTRNVYRWHGVTVHAAGGRNRALPGRLKTWGRAAFDAYEAASASRVIALHSFWLTECAYVASWLAAILGVSHVASIGGRDALRDNPYLAQLAFDAMIVTAGSAPAADAFRRSTGHAVNHVIPIGLDEEALAAPRPDRPRPIDILGVGSLTPVKNLRAFIDIVARLSADGRPLQCVILGDGPERASLERRIRDCGMDGVIRLAGHVSRETVLRFMRDSKILLHTAEYEGQGYVFLEAMAAGMRVVCRDVGYTGGNGMAHRCGSDEEMASVLKTLLRAAPGGELCAPVAIDQTAAAFERIYGI